MSATEGTGTRETRVAYQGAPGAYSEEAVYRACGTLVTAVPYRENVEVARALAVGDVELGLLPIENTLAGSVTVSYDAILGEPKIFAVAEVVLPIHHCVLGVPTATLDSLRVVESHPVALAQCAKFFDRHPSIVARAVYDTAGAALDISRARDVTRGAIASRLAASHYGLEILEADVEDREDNQTRFLVLSRSRFELARGTRARTLLVVTTENKPGALLRVLAPFAERSLNLVKLEARPTGEPWTYRFVLEVEHPAGDPSMHQALRVVAASSESVRDVGTYRAAG
jgi:prephenate dehydratase